MDAITEKLASLTGSSTDQIKVITLLLLAFPLSSVYIRIPTEYPIFRHLFSIVLSLFALLNVMKLYAGTVHVFASIFVTYLLLPWKHEYMPWTVFVFTMTDLMINHLYRAIFNLTPDDFDITYIQMTLVIKLTTLAWSVHDARQPDELLDKQQMASKVAKFPQILEYLGYCLYFPGLLVGPALEYNTYASLVSGTLHVPKDGKPVPAATTLVGRRRAAYKHMGFGLAMLGLWVIFGGKFSYFRVLEDSWLEKGPLNRIIQVQLMGIFQRTKYYAVWMLSEGACILTGLGFNGYTPEGKTIWNRATNVNIWKVETAPNVKILLDNWNINTNVWLRNCIYKRVTKRGKKPGFRSSMATFLVSAIWHGTETGYYLTFIQAGFVQTIGRMMRSCVRPFLLPPVVAPKAAAPPPPQVADGVAPIPVAELKPSRPSNIRASEPPPTPIKRVYDVLGVICTAMELNYMVAPFVLLHWKESLRGWGRMYWYGTWMTFGPLLFFVLGGQRFLLGKLKARAERERKRLELKENAPPVIVVPPSPITTSFPGQMPESRAESTTGTDDDMWSDIDQLKLELEEELKRERKED